MKTFLFILFSLTTVFTFGQTNPTVEKINFSVKTILQSDIPIHVDTLNRDVPQFGISMTNYLKSMVKDQELVMMENLVDGSTTIDGKKSRMTSSTIFYYGDGKLIKVMGYGEKDGERTEFELYFEEEEVIHYTVKPEARDGSEEELLEQGKLFLQLAKTYQMATKK
ncbi:MAG: hypothetical protein MRZ79_21550 [Bacteroidia bacterium]|nr:hypothetical protein [Bacteroidia bacterium]